MEYKILTESPEIICLCGSTRFMDQFTEWNELFTALGHIVLSVGASKYDRPLPPKHVEMLDELHRYKIQMADKVFIINKGGYIGESTRKEIEFAKSLKKPIAYSDLSSSKQVPIAPAKHPGNIDDDLDF